MKNNSDDENWEIYYMALNKHLTLCSQEELMKGTHK